MEAISEDSPFSNNLSVTLPTRCETVLKFKDRVIELNVCLISEDSSNFSDNLFGEHVSTSNSRPKLPVKLDVAKCFVMRKSSHGDDFVAETPRTSTPPFKKPISDSKSSSSLQSLQGTSKKTRKTFVCGICKRRFVYQFHYKNHILTHKEDTITTLKTKTDKGIFECSYNCGKTFASKDGAYKHEKRMHRPRSVKMYTCDQCPKFFSSPTGLSDHRITRHCIGLGLTCKSCGKTFASKKKFSCHVVSFPDHGNASGNFKP